MKTTGRRTRMDWILDSLSVLSILIFLAMLAGCTTASRGGIYFEEGLGVVDQVPPVPQWAKDIYGPDAHYKYDFNVTANPRARLAFGYEWNAPRARTSLEVRHESWLGVAADKGEESVWMSVRIFPFKWVPK